MQLTTCVNKGSQLVRNIKMGDNIFIGQMLGNNCCSNFKQGMWRRQQIYLKDQMFAAKKMSRSPSAQKDQVENKAMCLGVPSVEKYIQTLSIELGPQVPKNMDEKDIKFKPIFLGKEFFDGNQIPDDGTLILVVLDCLLQSLYDNHWDLVLPVETPTMKQLSTTVIAHGLWKTIL